jgi:hypothetical protein
MLRFFIYERKQRKKLYFKKKESNDIIIIVRLLKINKKSSKTEWNPQTQRGQMELIKIS